MVPYCRGAGNILRAKTKFNIVIRISPTYEAKKAAEVMGDILTKDKSYNAKITAQSYGFASKNFNENVKINFPHILKNYSEKIFIALKKMEVFHLYLDWENNILNAKFWLQVF